MLNKITTLEFNKLTTEKFAERSNQANLVTKTDLDKKLTSFNRKTTSNKVKCFELQKKLKSLITKNFFFQVDFYLKVMMDLNAYVFINQNFIR